MVCQTVLVFLRILLVFVDGFAVEVLDNEEVDGYAALVSMPSPLRVLAPRSVTVRGWRGSDGIPST
jgi:hypothetical protein